MTDASRYFATPDTVQNGGAAEDGRSLGARLREAREARGVSLPEIARELRIREDFLRALESGRFVGMPALPYAQGFVRAYATHLRLDPEEALARFRAEAGAPAPPPKLKALAPMKVGRWPGIGVVITSVLLGGALYGIWHYYQSDRGTPAAPQAAERVPGPTGTGPAAKPVENAEANVRAAPPAGEPAKPPGEGAEKAPPAAEKGPPSGQRVPGSGLGDLRAPGPPAPAAPPAPKPVVVEAKPPVALPPASLPPPPKPAVAEAGPPPAAKAPATAPPPAAPPAPAKPEARAEAKPEVKPEPKPASEPPKTAESKPATGAEPKPGETKPAEAKPGETKLAEAGAEKKPDAVANPERRVVMRAIAVVPVQFTDRKSGRLLSNQVMRPGNVFVVPKPETIAVTIQNAAGIVIELDGRRLKPLGAPGQVLYRFSLAPDDLAKLP